MNGKIFMAKPKMNTIIFKYKTFFIEGVKEVK